VPRFTEAELVEAIAASRSWTEAARRLGYHPRGGNVATVRRHAERLNLPTGHFDPDAARLAGIRRGPAPLASVLVNGSTYNRHHLKLRLLSEGLKGRECELCGQGELWRGQPMALVLDHINGVPDDNRLENLRMLCPNCAATLSTHCGRKNRRPRERIECAVCGRPFWPTAARQRHCSRACGQRWARPRGPRPERRKVQRPPSDELVAEVARVGYEAVGRRYGVSGNAVRKWLRTDGRTNE